MIGWLGGPALDDYGDDYNGSLGGGMPGHNSIVDRDGLFFLSVVPSVAAVRYDFVCVDLAGRLGQFDFH